MSITSHTQAVQMPQSLSSFGQTLSRLFSAAHLAISRPFIYDWPSYVYEERDRSTLTVEGWGLPKSKIILTEAFRQAPQNFYLTKDSYDLAMRAFEAGYDESAIEILSIMAKNSARKNEVRDFLRASAFYYSNENIAKNPDVAAKILQAIFSTGDRYQGHMTMQRLLKAVPNPSDKLSLIEHAAYPLVQGLERGEAAHLISRSIKQVDRFGRKNAIVNILDPQGQIFASAICLEGRDTAVAFYDRMNLQNCDADVFVPRAEPAPLNKAGNSGRPKAWQRQSLGGYIGFLYREVSGQSLETKDAIFELQNTYKRMIAKLNTPRLYRVPRRVH